MGEQEASQIAIDAYIYGYPLVTMEMTRRVITNVANRKARALQWDIWFGIVNIRRRLTRRSPRRTPTRSTPPPGWMWAGSRGC